MESKGAQLPLSHKAWAWLEKNQKQAITGTAIALVVGLTVWVLAWRHGEKQVKASQALSDVAVAQGPSGAAIAGATPQDYLKIAADYANSKAAGRALLLAAGALFTEGKYAESQAQFERFTREYRNSPLLGEALIGIASCLEAQGKVEQAISAYKELIARHPTSSVIPQAKFSLGGLYEVQKRPELARDMYEQVERESRFTILGSEAGMRLEELAEKNPNLAKAIGASTPGATTQLPGAAIQLPVPVGTNVPMSTVTSPPVSTRSSPAAASGTNLPAPVSQQ